MSLSANDNRPAGDAQAQPSAKWTLEGYLKPAPAAALKRANVRIAAMTGSPMVSGMLSVMLDFSRFGGDLAGAIRKDSAICKVFFTDRERHEEEFALLCPVVNGKAKFLEKNPKAVDKGDHVFLKTDYGGNFLVFSQDDRWVGMSDCLEQAKLALGCVAQVDAPAGDELLHLERDIHKASTADGGPKDEIAERYGHMRLSLRLERDGVLVSVGLKSRDGQARAAADFDALADLLDRVGGQQLCGMMHDGEDAQLEQALAARRLVDRKGDPSLQEARFADFAVRHPNAKAVRADLLPIYRFVHSQFESVVKSQEKADDAEDLAAALESLPAADGRESAVLWWSEGDVAGADISISGDDLKNSLLAASLIANAMSERRLAAYNRREKLAMEKRNTFKFGEIPQIPAERIAAVRKAEHDFWWRGLVEPVREHLAAESEETRRLWQDVLQTSEDSFDNFCMSPLEHRREFIGRGAENAFKLGCRYPVPIGFAYTSYHKLPNEIRDVFSRVWMKVKDDNSWPAATHLTLVGMMTIDRHVPLKLDQKQLVSDAVVKFLRETKIAPDELGAAWHVISFNSAKSDLSEDLRRAEAEGLKIDPWLKLMLDARAAYRRAWHARGTGYANTVTEQGWKIYREEIAKVEPLCEQAYAMRPELYQSCVLALEACKGDREALDKWVTRLMGSRPDCILGFSHYLFTARPRWCGSVQLMESFLMTFIRRQDFDTIVPIWAYERLIADLYDDEGGTVDENGSKIPFAKYLDSHRADFEPYFDGYRQSDFLSRANFVERAHTYLALADLAQRLGNEKEKDYWFDLFLKLGIPTEQVPFGCDCYSILAAKRLRPKF